MENQQNGDGDFQVDNDPDDFPSSSQSSGDVRRRDQEPEILKKNPPPVRPRPASTYGRRRTPHSNFNESNATSSNNSLMQQPTPIHDYEASPLSNTSNSFQELSEEPQSSSASAQNPSDIPSTSNGTSCATAVDGVKTRTFAQQVSREEMQIGEQARLLLNLFIQERAGVENAQVTPIIRDLCPADKSSMATAGFSDESLSDIALTLRRIGDDISRNAELNNFIEQVPVHSTRNVFMKDTDKRAG
ncbi:uncharacterized protein LOC143445399 [Clavelina lepadiformis]|uniref:uncharacterized protein LOC143445399 n=1 Tax=Clavelina lepadiformis TaxID=159417 RepID=UPI004041B87C